MGAKVFVDTNIILRFNHSGLSLHAEISTRLNELWSDGNELWISRQVVREYIVQITRPGLLAQPASSKEIETQIQGLHALFQVADESYATTSALVGLTKRYAVGGKQIHDANIVATMLVYQIGNLITLNHADFARYQPLITLLAP